MTTKTISAILAATALLAVSACKRDAADDADPAPAATPTAPETASILRPDVEAEAQLPQPALEPLIATIGFAETGATLSDSAKAQLDALLAEPQMDEDWPVTLGGHSDAGGTDAANLRASQARAKAVADYLTANGIEEDRIEIIAFGEQNPVEPNALPDGEPNEEGRQANRRVDIVVAESGGLSAMVQPEPEPEPVATPTQSLSQTISDAMTSSD